MDNWFMNFPLELLEKNKLTTVGTIRKNKKEIPKEFLPHKSRVVHSSLFGFYEKKIALTSHVPKKGKSVLVLSSFILDDRIDLTAGDLCKPEMIIFYNLTKGGVDEMCGTYSVSRKSCRWPLTVFFGLLNITGIN
ncbi:hypothetical protein X975_03242, partial [Stegodyphus mimosarum]